MDQTSRIKDLLSRGLFGGPGPKEIAEALRLIKPLLDTDLNMYVLLAQAKVLSRKPEEAVAACDQALSRTKARVELLWDMTKSDRWLHFWKAAALAVLEKEAAMSASLAAAYALDEDIRDEARALEEFEPYLEKPSFLSAVGLKPRVELGKDLQALVDALQGAKYLAAYRLGKKLKKTCPDRASVLDGLIKALDAIVSDLDEHGAANLADYGGRRADPQKYRDELDTYCAARRKLRKKGSRLSEALK